MRRERAGHTLQPTAVVHEAFIRLMDGQQAQLENRAHFFAIAARSMRRVLVDHARRRLADKRGGDAHQQVELDEDIALTPHQSAEVLGLDQALDRLERMDARQAQIVENWKPQEAWRRPDFPRHETSVSYPYLSPLAGTALKIDFGILPVTICV